jgi:hypothetical protein
LTIDLSASERERLARASIDWVLEYFTAQSTLPIYPTASAKEMSSQLAGSPPRSTRTSRRGDRPRRRRRSSIKRSSG